MMSFSFGSVFAHIGRIVDPHAAALIHGDQVTSWAAFDRRTDALAAAFVAAGARPGDKVAHLMRNGPAYLETTVASFKARLVHVNVSYRYTGAELFHIFENADTAIIVHDPELGATIAGFTDRLPHLRATIAVGAPLDALAESGAGLAPQGHRADDLLFIYTGGTTGLPKGVMWEQSALLALLGGEALTLDAFLAEVEAGTGRQRSLILPPLMHGSGFLVAIATLARGGTVVTVPGQMFDIAAVFAAFEAHRPDHAVIVGDAFARPLLRGLDAGGGSIASLRSIISSGTMWSPEVKAGLLRHNPDLTLIDALGSSESVGIGVSVQTHANAGAPTQFAHDDNTRVLDEQLRDVVPGSGVAGRVARGGPAPLGYYKDPAKSAATFVTINGKRMTFAGDWATVAADGSLLLLGRGSQCINTGGEKVFPEEVEEALKTHPLVEDALVFGVADPVWGEAVTAIVDAPGADPVALAAHVRLRLAGYKTPKRIIVVDHVPRGPNGKADYAAAAALAATSCPDQTPKSAC